MGLYRPLGGGGGGGSPPRRRRPPSPRRSAERTRWGVTLAATGALLLTLRSLSGRPEVGVAVAATAPGCVAWRQTGDCTPYG